MRVYSISAGYLKLDGGAMFGVVPKRMWASMNPPDANNLCTWAMRALLIQTDDRNILVDTGIGNKQDEKFVRHFEPQQPELLFASLAALGLQADDITDVFLTHLHFDHCGGAIWKGEDGVARPAFPKAKYWTNDRHWRWAMDPNDREKASFLKENFTPLAEAGLLKMIDLRPGASLCPGVEILPFDGHTEAMMGLKIQLDDGQELIYCADLIPSRWHIGAPYVMAYDVRPLVTMAEKAPLLEIACARNQILFFEHDPEMACARVARDERGRVSLRFGGSLEETLAHP